ncbi:unnamed protein product [Caenorhabditis auriculariae]|uniref:Serpentine receptor class gamma n=1 Tax=Caenorhabditis auriculariae TaxID=2777116 RepID=A0A8S1HLM5_9PELO|nr:unnamed protein product [Caenorhabditis auriculariae]
MEQLIAYGSIESMPLYNCSGRTMEEWAEKQSHRHVLAGLLDVVYGAIVEILYIPCVMVMLKKEYFKMSCYKIMALLGVVDMAAVVISSLLMATYSLRVLFSVNIRIYRICIIMLLPICYGCYFTFFTRGTIFSSTYQTRFFDPFLFENRTQEYANFGHNFNNFSVVVATTALYMTFCVAVDCRVKGLSSQRMSFQKQIFLQSFLICAANLFAFLNHAIMQFVPLPAWFTFIAQAAWQVGHGFPVLVYLIINNTIRNEIFGFFVKKQSTVTPSGVDQRSSGRDHRTNRSIS